MYGASSSCSVHEEDRRYGCHTHTVLLTKVAVNGCVRIGDGVCGRGVCVKVAGCMGVCMCVGRGEEGGCKKSERTYITRQRQSGGEKWGADIVNLGSLFP